MAPVAAAQHQLRLDLGRRPGDTLHFQNLKNHAHRLFAAEALAAMADVVVCSVVVCKRELAAGPTLPTAEHAYLYTFRFLLERLSWLARSRATPLSYTLADVRGFKIHKLRTYESILQTIPTEIAWRWVDAKGGKVDQPSRIEQLQLADIVASATFRAFESDPVRPSDQRYLQALAANIWRGNTNKITTYGLKMHPWNAATQAAYPWIGSL